jgi:hypothetical protein
MAFLNGPAYLALPRPENVWVVQDLIPMSGSMNLYGEPKAGKSFAALDLGIAVSSGKPDWLGFPIPNHGPVLFLQMDTARHLWMEQYVEAALSAGENLDNIYFSDRDDPDCPYPFDMRRAGGQWLKTQVEIIKPVLVIVDVWREIFDGDENSSEVGAQVWGALTNATKGAGLLVLSHEIKGNTDPSKGDTPLRKGARGSTFVAGKVDAIAKLKLNGQLHYVSRSAQESKLQLQRRFDGFWELDTNSVNAQATSVINRMNGKSQLQMARELASSTGMTVEAARSKIRRLTAEGGVVGQTSDHVVNLSEITI